METMSVSKFKAECLSVLEKIKRQKKRIRITKRGEPIAEVIPVENEKETIPLKETVIYLGDVVSPVDQDEWDASK
jgi:prevent-host-death family protein